MFRSILVQDQTEIRLLSPRAGRSGRRVALESELFAVLWLIAEPTSLAGVYPTQRGCCSVTDKTATDLQGELRRDALPELTLHLSDI
jgi:hypothetical protein